MILKSPEVIHPCCFDLWFGWRGEEFTTITPNNLLRIEHYPSSLWNRFFAIRQKHSRKPMFRASFFLEKYTRKLHPTGFSLESERWNNRENFLHSKAWRLFVEESGPPASEGSHNTCRVPNSEFTFSPREGKHLKVKEYVPPVRRNPMRYHGYMRPPQGRAPLA